MFQKVVHGPELFGQTTKFLTRVEVFDKKDIQGWYDSGPHLICGH